MRTKLRSIKEAISIKIGWDRVKKIYVIVWELIGNALITPTPFFHITSQISPNTFQNLAILGLIHKTPLTEKEIKKTKWPCKGLANISPHTCYTICHCCWQINYNSNKKCCCKYKKTRKGLMRCGIFSERLAMPT